MSRVAVLNGEFSPRRITAFKIAGTGYGKGIGPASAGRQAAADRQNRPYNHAVSHGFLTKSASPTSARSRVNEYDLPVEVAAIKQPVDVFSDESLRVHARQNPSVMPAHPICTETLTRSQRDYSGSSVLRRRGLAGSGRAHGTNSPRPASPHGFSPSHTTSPRDIVNAGHALRCMPSYGV